MTARRKSMRQVREVLRLKLGCGRTLREVARAVGIGASTALEYLRRAEASGLGWPLPPELDDAAIEAMLFTPAGPAPAPRPAPDWAAVHAELKRKGVTLLLLWREYRAVHRDGYGYSRFCAIYQKWRARLSPTMRQVHQAGDKLFVDFAGQTLPIYSADGGVRNAHLFVAVMGASSYTFATLCWSEGLEDWIHAHAAAFAFFGGVTAAIVPDNLKAGVTKACRYEPGVNRTYEEFARCYGTAVLPARVRKPRDKAKVEAGVLVAERWILACLRNRRFLSLEAAEAAVRELVGELNDRPMRDYKKSRAALFAEIDAPALKPLPAEPYVYAEWKIARLGPDYHVEFDGHWYSAPYQLIKETLDLRATARAVEIFHRGRRVAAHPRSRIPFRHTTMSEHMPSSHRRYADWTQSRLKSEAAGIGAAASALVDQILAERPHPEQGFRACLGIVGLKRRFGAERLEAACARGLSLGARTYGAIADILKSGLEKAFLEPDSEAAPIVHNNIRGRNYYH
jgi:transposase